jgi:hypothetical protein
LKSAATSEKRPGHGAYSKAIVQQKGVIEKRRLLRQLGVSQQDLSPIAVAYLDSWARLKAKLLLLDRWLAEHKPELVDEAGETPSFTAFYVSLANAERHALAKLEQHLEQRPATDPFAKYKTIDAVANGD